MDMLSEALAAERQERELYFLTERLDALIPYCNDEGALPYLRASFADVGVSQESISGIVSRLLELIKEGLEKLVSLLVTLWEKIVAQSSRIWSKFNREKAATDRAKGSPEKPEVEVPGDAEGEVGEVDDLEDRAVALLGHGDDMEQSDRVVEEHVEEASQILKDIDSDLSGLSEEDIAKLKEAREKYALKGAESPLVKNAPVISITRLNTGGERTIRLLMELGKDGLYSQTDTDKDGKVISHRQYKAPLPDDRVNGNPKTYKAAQKRDIQAVIHQYEKLLKSVDATRKRKVGKELAVYRKRIKGLILRVKGAAAKGEITEEIATALLMELNKLNAVMAQLGGPSRVLTEAQLREVSHGIDVVKALRENLK